MSHRAASNVSCAVNEYLREGTVAQFAVQFRTPLRTSIRQVSSDIFAVIWRPKRDRSIQLKSSIFLDELSKAKRYRKRRSVSESDLTRPIDIVFICMHLQQLLCQMHILYHNFAATAPPCITLPHRL